MKIIRVILIFASLFSAAYGVVVTGAVVDSSSNSPLSGVSVVFRVGENPDAYPKTITDSVGRFSLDAAVEQNVPLQIFFEKSEYLLKNVTILITGNSIDLGTITMVKPAEFTAYFYGTVLDSVTGSGLAGVQIIVLRKWGDSVPYLQPITDSLGNFGLDVPVSGVDMNGRAVWYIEKQGYYLASGTITANMDSIHQTILMQPEGSIRVQVTGRIIDSQTRAVIPNARVILFTTFLEVEKDTSLADSNGTFDRSVQAAQVSAAMPAVVYLISAPGYAEKNGGVTIIGMTAIDLGEIALSMTKEVQNKLQSAQVKYSGKEIHRVFLLNGRLYPTEGQKIMPRNRYRAASQMVIIQTTSCGYINDKRIQSKEIFHNR